MSDQIRFEDGAGYERYMGVWSELVAQEFLAWLAPPMGLRWLDVGCGNGAFTEEVATCCAPLVLHGVDPSEAQLAYARTRPALVDAVFRPGDAMALPFADRTFDVAVMPLVIFFVPDPAKGLAEMLRVARPGAIIAAYAWDMPGQGFPYVALQDELRALGLTVPMPPSADVSSLDALQDLWTSGGLRSVAGRTITVERTFDDFDDYWATVLKGPSVGGSLASLPPDTIAKLQTRLRKRLKPARDGRITLTGTANAVKGFVPRA